VLLPDYPIRTARLLLRPLDPATDVDAVHGYQSRADVTRYVPYGPRTRDEVAANLSDPTRVRSGLDEEGQVLNLAVVLAESGQVIGEAMIFWRSRRDQLGELGYILDPDAHGHGYAVEACEAMLALAFDGLGLHRVIARIDERNAASAAVARRLGMRHESTFIENEWFKGEWSSEIDFAILDREWCALRDAPAEPADAPASS
jgi:RimJ/RimL family protein N-acetyltransferase